MKLRKLTEEEYSELMEVLYDQKGADWPLDWQLYMTEPLTDGYYAYFYLFGEPWTVRL